MLKQQWMHVIMTHHCISQADLVPQTIGNHVEI